MKYCNTRILAGNYICTSRDNFKFETTEFADPVKTKRTNKTNEMKRHESTRQTPTFSSTRDGAAVRDIGGCKRDLELLEHLEQGQAEALGHRQQGELRQRRLRLTVGGAG